MKAPTQKELLAEIGIKAKKKRKKPCIHTPVREVETSTSTPSYVYYACSKCGKIL